MSDSVDSQGDGQFDRLPPHSIEAEQCLLASMMLSADVMDDVECLIDRSVFYQVDHQIIFDVLKHLRAGGKPIDAVLVREELLKRQLLEEVGGAAYLAQLLNTVPSAAHAQHYAGIVREKHLLRQIISASNDTLRDAYAPRQDVGEVVERFEKRAMGIQMGRVVESARSILDDLAAAYDQLEGKSEHGLPTGFAEIDDLILGLHPGQMIVVAARPAVGKSSLALQIAEHVAGAGNRADIFSLEMKRRELVPRLLCSHAGIDLQQARKGMLSAIEYSRAAESMNALSKYPLFIDDTPSMGIGEFRAKSRRAVRAGSKLLVIDYIQLMEPSDRRVNRNEQLSEISRGVKLAAQELDVPIIAVCQLNREMEKQQRRPRISDIRDCGQLEADADTIILLHREDQRRAGEEENFIPDGKAEIIVGKSRTGPTGIRHLEFEPKYTRFRSMAESKAAEQVRMF